MPEKRKLPTWTGKNDTDQTQINFLEPIGRRLLQVVRIEDISPKYRRIILAGQDLDEGFPYRDFAPTDHVKVFFPNPENGELVFPTITHKGWEYPEGAADPIYRDYTVRSWDEHTKEISIDFVIHDHGIAGKWARDAQVGAELGVLGPRGNILFPETFDNYIVAGDETALPAISRFIEEAPAASHVTAVIEVADAHEQQDLTGAATIDIQWVPRDEVEVAQGHVSALETALRQVEYPAVESLFMFVAGEASALKPIRRFLRNEVGLPKTQLDVDGYWKKGIANLDHHSVELNDDDED